MSFSQSKERRARDLVARALEVHWNRTVENNSIPAKKKNSFRKASKQFRHKEIFQLVHHKPRGQSSEEVVKKTKLQEHNKNENKPNACRTLIFQSPRKDENCVVPPWSAARPVANPAASYPEKEKKNNFGSSFNTKQDQVSSKDSYRLEKEKLSKEPANHPNAKSKAQVISVPPKAKFTFKRPIFGSLSHQDARQQMIMPTKQPHSSHSSDVNHRKYQKSSTENFHSTSKEIQFQTNCQGGDNSSQMESNSSCVPTKSRDHHKSPPKSTHSPSNSGPFPAAPWGESTPSKRKSTFTSVHPDDMEADQWYALSPIRCSPSSTHWKQTAVIISGGSPRCTPTPEKHVNSSTEIQAPVPKRLRLSFEADNRDIGNFSLSLSISENSNDQDSDYHPAEDSDDSGANATADNSPLRAARAEGDASMDISYQDLNVDVQLGVPCTPGEEDNDQQKKRHRRYVKNTSRTRIARKEARNLGQGYITNRGKEMPARFTKHLSPCRNKCSEFVSHNVASVLCETLWKMGDHNKRRLYLSSLIDCKPTATSRKRRLSPSKQKNRTSTMVYHVPIQGEKKVVCQGCFIKIFDITKKMVNIISSQKSCSPLQAITDDGRGKSSSSALSEEKRLDVVKHIQSFPCYKSHYSRALTNKKFLPPHLDLATMYKEYSALHENGVSRYTYEREFHKLGLSFKTPKTDTCSKCDSLYMAALNAPDEATRIKNEENLQLHHRKAEKALDSKTNDKLYSRMDKNSRKVISFDLQQCLPTPHLTTSVIYYKRQLWTYNLTIHDSTLKKSINSMWHEGMAKRGANEVGSALYTFIMNLPDTVKELTAWSDTCGGQNKNNVINAMFHAAFAHKQTLQVINQKFLVAGHTHLECDPDHGKIEAKKRKAVQLYLPRDYYNLVANCGPEFSVTEMKQDKQYNFAKLLEGAGSPLVKKKKNTNKEDFKWKDVVWFQYTRDVPSGVVKYKNTHCDDFSFSRLDMRRYPARGNPKYVLEKSYNGPIPINTKKKQDLLSILHLIDSDCHEFYRSLCTEEESCEVDAHPDICSEVDSEESFYEV